MRILRYVSIATLSMIWALSSVAAAPPDTIQVLADQAFLKLHDIYVSNPNTFETERVARSTSKLPLGFPFGTFKGLVREEYVLQAFQSAGLTGLDQGRWMIFTIPDLDMDVVLYVKRDSNGEIQVVNVSGGKNTAILGILGCGGDDDFNCNCAGAGDSCDSCIGPGSEVWSDTGETTSGGNAIMESTSGDTAEDCSGSGAIRTLAPL